LAKNALFCAYLFRQASMSSRLEAGEHLAGWEYGPSPQDMRLWLLKGTADAPDVQNYPVYIQN
jgi:hypothetical protein